MIYLSFLISYINDDDAEINENLQNFSWYNVEISVKIPESSALYPENFCGFYWTLFQNTSDRTNLE